MVEFRWIMFPLFLMLVFSLTAVTGKHSSDTVRVGDEVTLSCENVKHEQEKCDSTTWIFSHSTNVVPLFEDGQIHKEAEAKSDRLSVRENCSLVLKKVTVEDVGSYTCRQFKSGEQQGPDTHVHLSVVTMTEQDNDEVMSSCSVSSRGQCKHRLKWLYEGKDVTEDKDMTTSQSDCSATVTFPTSDLKKSKHRDLFTCEVTDIYNGKVQQFTFSHQSSGEKTGDEKTTATTVSPTTDKSTSATGNKWTSVKMSTSFGTNPTASTNNSDGTKQEGWWWFIIVSVGLAGFLIILVAVIRQKRAEGNKMRTDEHTAEDGDLYVNISYTRKANRQQVRGDDGDEGDAGTYSTGKASFSSLAASTGPRDFYTTVNKPKKKKLVKKCSILHD